MDRIRSYTAASSLPAKLLRIHQHCVDPTTRFIYPYHIQVCPTNVCNLNCSFCSCTHRERTQFLHPHDLIRTIGDFKQLGTRAVTITGGGEPCCYPDLDMLIDFCYTVGIEMGLVTNGLLLPTKKAHLDKLTWCRVSASDDRDIDQLLVILSELVSEIKIDWAISYVVTKDFNLDNFSKVVQFANNNNLTHVRAVSDLMDLNKAVDMGLVRDQMFIWGIDDSKVIYQDRQQYSRGSERCLISLLKPLVAPDGFIYPCCGVQYALPQSEGLFPERMRICHMNEVRDFVFDQVPFDGLICKKCYYSEYNQTLDILLSDYDHLGFV